MNTNHSTDKRLWLFVLARVYLGASFFFSDHGSAKPGELTGFLQYGMQHGYSWYQKFLSATVIPHAATFGTLIVIAIIILLSNAGRVLGVDQFLHKRFPKIPIW